MSLSVTRLACNVLATVNTQHVSNDAYNVASGRRTTVGADDDALVELDSHDGGLWTGMEWMSDACEESFEYAYPEIDLPALEPVHINTIHAAVVVVLCSVMKGCNLSAMTILSCG